MTGEKQQIAKEPDAQPAVKDAVKASSEEPKAVNPPAKMIAGLKKEAEPVLKVNRPEAVYEAESDGNAYARAMPGDSGQKFAGARANGETKTVVPRQATQADNAIRQDGETKTRKPRESHFNKARSFDGDLRTLPLVKPVKRERPEHDDPVITPVPYPGSSASGAAQTAAATDQAFVPTAAAPSPSKSFEGLDFANWGAGHPPDTNGDVGPQYYIQNINTSIGIYQKSDGTRVAAFTFNTLMSQGHFGNLCDTDNFGDPVVLYDSFEDRWVISDFAFKLDGSGNVINPPGDFQCVAVSKTGDPVVGGWNFYSTNVAGGLGDYPKLGVWPDGIYMSVNLFGFAKGAAFINPRVFAFNKAQMYAGAPTVQILSFDAPSAEFTLLPSNARLQTGTPPIGSPNYFSVVAQFSNAISVYKFHADWSHVSLSTLTGPFITIAPASWASAPATVATSGGTNIDTLQPRLMVQSQYTNIGGVESLWNSHTVLGGAAATAAPRFYQVTVTGGTIAASTTQAFTHKPDNTVNRFMPSAAVDRVGDMALGYSATSTSLFPAIRYAGRLATDPVNTLPQTETSLIEGTGTQNTASFTRWGDYSAMTLDPDGCTFWYTAMYYQATG